MESFLGWELENEEKRTEKGRVAQGLLAKGQGLGMGLGFACKRTVIPGEIGNALRPDCRHALTGRGQDVPKSRSALVP